MRKYLLCSLTLAVLFLISISSADATLLGVDLTDLWPDIDSNNIGLVTFTPANPGTPGQGGNVTYSAFANRIAYSMSDVDQFQAYDPGPPPQIIPAVKMTVSMDINSTGNLTSGSMSLIVEPNLEVWIRGNPYGPTHGNATLLSGTVTAFGWQNHPTSGKMEYDAYFANLTGALINDGIWPTYTVGWTGHADSGSWPTGPNGDDWWNRSDTFQTEKNKSDMAPIIPEPATLILLGSGLVGLIGYAWRRKKKQS
jgi:hypothetical protein